MAQVMETITNMTTDNIKNVKKSLCTLSIKRNNTTGVTLKIKSPLFADFFSTGRESEVRTNVKIENISVQSVMMSSNLDNENKHYRNFYDINPNLFNEDNKVNLSFLLEKRIGAGVEFSINGRYSTEAILHFRRQFKEEISEFYMQNMRDVDISCNISIIEAQTQ